jgi:hypothetical protein
MVDPCRTEVVLRRLRIPDSHKEVGIPEGDVAKRSQMKWRGDLACNEDE